MYEFLTSRFRISSTSRRHSLRVLSRMAGLLVMLFSTLRRRCRLSNFTILFIGAMLGLGGGLFFLRDFIFTPGLANMWEMVWPYSSELYPWYFTWDQFRQYPTIINHMMVYLLVYPFPAEIAQRLLYLLPFTIMGMSMFFVIFKLTAPRHKTAKVPLIAATLASLIFMCNPVVIYRLTTWYHMWFYALLPFLVYLSYTTFRGILQFDRTEFIKKSILLALLLSIMSASERMPYYFPFLLLGFFAGFSRLFWWDYLKRSFLLIALTLLLYPIFSSLWLIPLATGSPATANDLYILSRPVVESYSANADLFNVFSLQYCGWNQFDKLFWIPDSIVPFWEAALLAVPIIGFSSILFRRSKLIIWLVIFALACIFLGKGINPPLGDVYYWLVFDAPIVSFFGWQFRLPLMWLMPLMFCYSMLFGITISSFLGWARDRIKWKKMGWVIFAISIIVLLPVSLLPGYPLLTGHPAPMKVGIKMRDTFMDVAEFVKRDPSDTKMLWLDLPYSWGSPKPSTPPGSYMEPGQAPYGYVYLHNELPNTVRFGEVLSVWNARYLVAIATSEHAKPMNYAELLRQEDLEQVQQFGPYYVFEYPKDTSQVEASTQSVAVQGGWETMLSLLAVDSYDMTRSPTFFLDQLVTNSDYLPGADVLVSNQYSVDIYLSQLEEKYMISPYDVVDDHHDTKWTKASPKNLGSSQWHFYLKNSGLESRQFTYDKRLVWTNGHDPLYMPFEVDQSGDYHILIRYLQSTSGHSGITVSLDDVQIGEIATKGLPVEWRWTNIGIFDLQQGSHTLGIQNVRGLNAVNLLAVVPPNELERYQAQVDETLIGKRIVHIWEAESALNRSGAEISGIYAGNASNGEVLNLSTGSRAWRDIDILRDGSYRMAVRLNGSARVSIDDQDFTLSSNELDFVYLSHIDMTKGTYTLQITPDSGQCDLDVVWLYSVEEADETVDDIFVGDESPAQVIEYEKIDPTKYRVRVSASEPFMLSFADSYNRLWEASVNGKMYPSVPLHTFINGFWIEDTGEMEIIIEFRSQKWLYRGAIITVISIVAALAFLLWNWRKGRWRWLGRPTLRNIKNSIETVFDRIRHRSRSDKAVID